MLTPTDYRREADKILAPVAASLHPPPGDAVLLLMVDKSPLPCGGWDFSVGSITFTNLAEFSRYSPEELRRQALSVGGVPIFATFFVGHRVVFSELISIGTAVLVGAAATPPGGAPC